MAPCDTSYHNGPGRSSARRAPHTRRRGVRDPCDGTAASSGRWLPARRCDSESIRHQARPPSGPSGGRVDSPFRENVPAPRRRNDRRREGSPIVAFAAYPFIITRRRWSLARRARRRRFGDRWAWLARVRPLGHFDERGRTPRGHSGRSVARDAYDVLARCSHYPRTYTISSRKNGGSLLNLGRRGGRRDPFALAGSLVPRPGLASRAGAHHLLTWSRSNV